MRSRKLPGKATVTYRLKAQYSRKGKKKDPYGEPSFGKQDLRPLICKFCARHSQRGDCGLEDADDNYEVLEGLGLQAPPKADESKSGGPYFVYVESDPQ